MKIFLMLIALLFSFTCFAETTLQEVIDLYTKANGGKEAMEKVQSVEMSLTIQEPKFSVDAIYHADRKIRMRIDIFADGKRVYTEAYDGKNGWSMNEGGQVKDESEAGTAALRNGIFYPGKIFGLHELTAVGQKVSYDGREEVDGVSYHVVKITTDRGMEKYLYIHPDNGRIERTRDFRALHVDMDPKKKNLETRLSDFRTVDGLAYAFQSVEADLNTKQVLQTTTLKSVKINPEIDPTIYNKPPEQ